MDLINICVMGSCVTRDMFNSRFVADYKDYYNLVSSCYQTSLISIMSNKMELEIIDIEENVKGHQQQVLDKDMKKTYLQEIVKSKPEYIIIDFYADIRYGILKIGENYITNNPNNIKKTSFYKDKKFDYQYTLAKDTEIYFELFKDSFERFYKFMKEKLPNTKLIVHKIRFTDSYIDKDGSIKLFTHSKYNFIDIENRLSNKYYDYIKTNYDLYMIDLSDTEYLAESRHLWGLTPYHYEIKYHNDFMSQLYKICLKDLLSMRKKINNILNNRDK